MEVLGLVQRRGLGEKPRGTDPRVLVRVRWTCGT